MLNFDLRAELVDPVAGRLTVAVTGSPAGEVDAVAVAAPPVTLDAACKASSAPHLHDLAAAFTAAVLPAPLWTAWRASVAAAGVQGVRLRIRSAEGGAAALPWELLYDAARAAFLAHDPLTPVVRYLEGRSGEGETGSTQSPISNLSISNPPISPSLLLTAATPVDLPGLAGTELDAVGAAVQPARFLVQRIDHLTAHGLEATLTEQRPALFHFSGHGFWSAYDAEGGLALESVHGHAELLDGATLAMLLAAARTQVVVLNACATAQGGAARWSGLAQALVRRGAPVVVAQRAAVEDDLAQAFAEGFYRSLAVDGSVERGVTFGRLSMARLGAVTGRPGAWLSPVLFQRQPVRLWQGEAEDGDGARNRVLSKNSVSPIETPPPRSSSIGTVNAVNFLGEGAMNVDMRHATIHLPAAAPSPATDARLDQVLAGQAELGAELDAFQAVVLSSLSGAEQRIVVAVLAGVDAQSRRHVEAIMLAVQDNHLAAADLQTLLAAVAAVHAEVRGHGAALADLSARLDLLAVDEAVAAVVGPTDAEFKHRLVMTVPLVPFLLSYEGEVELKSRLGLDAAWQALLARIRA